MNSSIAVEFKLFFSFFPDPKFKANMSNHIPGDLDPSSCVFMMCDIQEKFRPAISNFEAVVENARRLTSARYEGD